MTSGDAHEFRTVIRREAASGPNFAGRYTIVRIGCGAGNVCPAIVDAGNGRVFFPPMTRVVSQLPFDAPVHDLERLNHRLDSRLLVVIGSLNEEPATAGFHELEWRGDQLRRVRFVPYAELCASSPS